MSRGRRRTVKGARRPRLRPRLPQRLRDLDRAPGAQHRRLGLDQRPPDPERDDPRRARRLPGRPALRKRRRRKGTEEHPARRHQGPRRAGGRRAAPGGRRRRRKGAGNLDRAGALGRRQPHRPRTAARGAGRQEGSGLDRGRRTSASTSAASLTNLAGQVGIGAEPGRKAAARRRPDRDPPLRPAEDGAEHRGRDQGPGAGALDPHLRRLRRWRSTSPATAAG